jgi:predicted phosphoribosyltransferase|tara:strand:- start:65 stop:382 length:318 start_codon:yes stop_codon:yes gene_type:complete
MPTLKKEELTSKQKNQLKEDLVEKAPKPDVSEELAALREQNHLQNKQLERLTKISQELIERLEAPEPDEINEPSKSIKSSGAMRASVAGKRSGVNLIKDNRPINN